MLRLFVITLVLSTAAGQFDFLKSITKGVSKGLTKEVSAITDPIEKTVMAIGFSQCNSVKRLIGVDYDRYNEKSIEPDLSKIDVEYITRNMRVSYNLSVAATVIPKSEWFNPRTPLKIYLHGFFANPMQADFTTIRQEFLDFGDFNIVALDVSSLIRWQYLRATTMVNFIGEALGKLLAALYQAGVAPSSIHLLGHSLGSHIAGFAGQTFQTLTGHKVGRITGLDPAGPCFSNLNQGSRLNVNDADFVDVIHTDAGVYGIWEQIGHVDFYPNSGSQQPGCLTSFASCNHDRSWQMYAESVKNPLAFPAVSCPDWRAFRNKNCNYTNKSFMGHGCAPSSRGTYFLRTNDEPPFGLGDKGVIWVNNDGYVKSFVNSVSDLFQLRQK